MRGAGNPNGPDRITKPSDIINTENTIYDIMQGDPLYRR